ncbi:DUF4124 domain-containing protein [Paucibacter sediminis]|uniref:DUF4124 domain-containing protein n=1 Tax=Paucibacter sediminis TaxID=3019553 RepID=A0AA95NAJ4_9BURK|nr:DUF4124 domain-containing protein [Paucibacter sp. S2-9]WIT10479.1 DUF4124 domain-containing protein [Paucibacter sp. S2-9]
MSAPRISNPPAGFYRLIVCLALLALAGTAQAQWKWRDARGNVQYSDLPPPPGVAEKDILQRPVNQRQRIVVTPVGIGAANAASAPAAAASAPARPDPDAAARKKQEQEQAAQRAEEDRKLKAQKAENCKTAQGQLRLLEDGVRISRKDERGERVFLDDQQRAEETKRARAIIAVDCAR